MSYHQISSAYKSCLQKVLSRLVLSRLVLSRLIQLSRQSFTIYPYRVFVKWFFFFRDPEVLRKRFDDCFVGVPW